MVDGRGKGIHSGCATAKLLEQLLQMFRLDGVEAGISPTGLIRQHLVRHGRWDCLYGRDIALRSGQKVE